MSSESTPSLKRPRIDEDKDPQQNSSMEAVRNSKYWFDDGNIILQAEEVQFRVHRSMLAQHSTIFSDTFAIPQPPLSIDDMVDGCPLVSLSDSAKDWETILSIFYDNIKALDLTRKIPFGTVRAMLRIGSKYDIPYLKTRALELLHSDYPSTLADWDKTFTTSKLERNSASDSGVIMLAEEFSLRTLLPSACFQRTFYGSLQELYLGKNEDADAKLSSEARMRCIVGRDKYLFWLSRTYQKWRQAMDIRTLAPKCQGKPSRCSQDLMLRVFDSFKLWHTEYHRIPQLIEPTVVTSELMCSPCLQGMKAYHERIRASAWAELPSFFGLGKWEGLKDELL